MGKRNKWRTVFLPGRVTEALQAHWADRGQDFSFGLSDLPLLSPLVVPSTDSAQARHVTDRGVLKEVGFSADGLYQVIKSTLRRMADDDSLELEDADRERLQRAAPHAFRHTERS